MARFIDVDNMRAILAELDAAFQQVRPDIARAREIGAQPKEVVFDTMVGMARDPAFEGMTVGQLNEVVIETTLSYYAAIADRVAAAESEPSRELVARAPASRALDLPGGSGGGGGGVAPGTFGNADDGPEDVPEPSSALRVLSLEDGNKNVPRVMDPPRPPSDDGDKVVKRALSLDGSDRDRDSYPSRHSFATVLSAPLRMVKSVRVCAVVIPVQDHTVNCTHIFIAVDELPSAYTHSSNSTAQRSFAKLVPKSTYQAVHAYTQLAHTVPAVQLDRSVVHPHVGAYVNPSQPGRSYVVLEPVLDSRYQFDPPISSLDRLTTRLLRPDGTPVSAVDDRYVISKVTLSPDDTWHLHTTARWHTQEFAPGDIVSVQGSRTGNARFDSFLNRDTGHVVICPGGYDIAVANEGASVIIIRCAGEVDENGQFVRDKGVHEAFEDNGEVSSVVVSDDADAASGAERATTSVMNLSLQMSITMEAECQQSAMPSMSAT